MTNLTDDSLTTLDTELSAAEAEEDRAYAALCDAEATVHVLGTELDPAVVAAHERAQRHVVELRRARQGIQAQKKAADTAKRAETAKAKEQSLESALIELNTAGEEIDAARSQLEAAATRWAAAVQRVAPLADTTIQQSIIKAQLSLKIYVLHACRPIPSCRTGQERLVTGPFGNLLPKPKKG